MNVKISVQIDGQEFQLSVENARKLHDELSKIFGRDYSVPYYTSRDIVFGPGFSLTEEDHFKKYKGCEL